MNPLLIVLRVLSTAVSVYAFLCMIRIILTWVPQASGSGVGNLLAKICDPYLNLFRNIKWLRFGSFDFGPALALCLLGAVSALLGSFSAGGFSLSYLLQTLVGLVWNIINSVLIFLVVVLVIRLIILLSSKNSYSSSPLVNALDSSVGTLAQRISGTFTGNKRVSYKAQLITAIVVLIVVMVVGSLLISGLCNLIGLIPV